jgi:tight adherence protein C
VTPGAAAAAAAAAAVILAALAALDLLASLLVRAGRPRLPAGVLPALASLRAVRRLRASRDAAARLAAAGDPGGLGVREWMAVKACCAAGAAATALPVLLAGPGRVGLLLALAAPAAGYALPELWLARAVRARAEAAVRELPDMLDLLRVSVEGGVAPVHAMGKVGAQFGGPLATEWRRAATAVALGEPRSAALERIRMRLAAEEVAAFADAFARAMRHGLPLGPTLATHASRAREARRRRIRERAARAGPKMQLVVALVLVPSMLLIVTAILISELEPGLGLAG